MGSNMLISLDTMKWTGQQKAHQIEMDALERCEPKGQESSIPKGHIVLVVLEWNLYDGESSSLWGRWEISAMCFLG
jgi:hypothetical protein